MKLKCKPGGGEGGYHNGEERLHDEPKASL